MPNIRPLSPELAEKARLELNEKPERIDTDLQALRDWLAKSPHIKARTDDQFLVNFLRACKYSLERTKEKLDSYYTIRSAIPEIFKRRDPSSKKAQELLLAGTVIPLPNYSTPDGPLIIVARPGITDPEKYGPLEAQSIASMLGDVLFRENDNFIVAGIEVLVDMKDISTAHMVQFTPKFIKQMALVNQEGNPIRQKGNHYINMPSFVMTLMNIWKTFLNEKNRSRMNIYGDNFEGIFEKIPRRLLPTEYGGEAGTIEEIMKEWVKKCESYAEYFKEEDNYGTDESKRPGGKRRDAETLFGIDGSFRKLEVD